MYLYLFLLCFTLSALAGPMFVAASQTSLQPLNLTREKIHIMTSLNGNIFRETCTLCGEFTGHRWIPRTKDRDAELWWFLWSAPWINDWVNTREVGDLRHQSTHYEVIVMYTQQLLWRFTLIYEHPPVRIRTISPILSPWVIWLTPPFAVETLWYLIRYWTGSWLL